MSKRFYVIAAFLFALFCATITTGFSQTIKKPVKKSLAIKKTMSKKTVVVKKKEPGIRIKITTDSGVIIVRLYDSTPLHRDNFVKLVKEGFYDSLLFHRVIQEFMIQGGDPLSKTAPAGMQLGMGGGDMQRIPAEFRKDLIHKKGALAAARDGNPERASSACQFYIVQGRKYSLAELTQMEMQTGVKYTAAQKNIYVKTGGVPFLDMNYTVFGEVESGLKVIDKIAAVAKDGNDRPLGDVRMKMEILQ
ncbi:peptidylprolyl isomerase [Ferruginibacter lapsinanis]|uniref:peptidylprolyl isomerase n=1 Tax=Ferruginibacter lapsinanis TaxID=563172 RepID=UPI00293E1BAD|nr:peptidylprolyl isomerase [Ferruginibacter lapsinanis]